MDHPFYQVLDNFNLDLDTITLLLMRFQICYMEHCIFLSKNDNNNTKNNNNNKKPWKTN